MAQRSDVARAARMAMDLYSRAQQGIAARRTGADGATRLQPADYDWNRLIGGRSGMVALAWNACESTLGILQQFWRSTGGAAPARPSADMRDSRPAAAPATTMLLEDEAGKLAVGAFLVENLLPRDIVTRVGCSGFTDAAGNTIETTCHYDPAEIRLSPGQQVVVKVAVLIPDGIPVGRPYQGQLAVADLPGSSLIAVLRRRAPGTAPPSAPEGVQTP